MSMTAYLVLVVLSTSSLVWRWSGEGVDNLVSLGENLLQAAAHRNDFISSIAAKTFRLKQPDVLSCQCAK